MTLEQRLATEKRRSEEQRQAHETAKLAFLKRSTETIEQLRQERDELLKRVQQAEEEARVREAKLRDLKEEVGSEAYRTRRAEGELKVLREERADWTSSMDELRGLLEIERRKNAQREASAAGHAVSPLSVSHPLPPEAQLTLRVCLVTHRAPLSSRRTLPDPARKGRSRFHRRRIFRRH